MCKGFDVNSQYFWVVLVLPKKSLCDGFHIFTTADVFIVLISLPLKSFLHFYATFHFQDCQVEPLFDPTVHSQPTLLSMPPSCPQHDIVSYPQKGNKFFWSLWHTAPITQTAKSFIFHLVMFSVSSGPLGRLRFIYSSACYHWITQQYYSCVGARATNDMISHFLR